MCEGAVTSTHSTGMLGTKRTQKFCASQAKPLLQHYIQRIFREENIG